jgi:hypothetical protein
MTDRDRRGSFRALTPFSASFRYEPDKWIEGKIGDIPATGIRMNCEELVAIGTLLDLRVTLPSSVLDIYPEETAVIDTTHAVPTLRVAHRVKWSRSTPTAAAVAEAVAEAEAVGAILPASILAAEARPKPREKFIRNSIAATPAFLIPLVRGVTGKKPLGGSIKITRRARSFIQRPPSIRSPRQVQ